MADNGAVRAPAAVVAAHKVDVAAHSAAIAAAVAAQTPSTIANAVRLPGTTGNYVSTPDSVALSLAGDMDVRVKVSMDDWTPSGVQTFIAKRDASFISWQFTVAADGTLGLGISIDGTTFLGNASTAAVAATAGVVDGGSLWCRVTRVSSTGVIKFWWSRDGVTYTQLGTDVAGTSGALYDNAAVVEIGSNRSGANNNLAGYVYYAEIRSSAAGTIVGFFDATVLRAAARTPSTVTLGGAVWTLVGSALDWARVAQ
jgi:hypothetical protein